MIIRTPFDRELDKGLRGILKKAYKHTPIEYADPIIKSKKLKSVKYNLGYSITPELLRDDLYGDVRMRTKNKGKLMIRTEYIIETYFGKEIVADTSGIISIGEMSVTSASAKEIADAIYKLLKKTNYKPEPELLVKKRKRKK